MYEQLDIFSFLNPQSKKYCFDDDINDIRKMLIDIAEKHKCKVTDDNFSIWSHVPQYGYRLSIDIEVTKDVFRNKEFRQEIDKAVDFAEEREVSLHPMYGAVFFFSGEDTATFSFFTTFNDKKRRKIK